MMTSVTSRVGCNEWGEVRSARWSATSGVGVSSGISGVG